MSRSYTPLPPSAFVACSGIALTLAYPKNYTKRINTLRGENAELLNVKVGTSLQKVTTV
jgi:hypothetical protein